MKYRIQTELVFDVDAENKDDARVAALLQLGMGDIGNDDITYLNAERIAERPCICGHESTSHHPRPPHSCEATRACLCVRYEAESSEDA